MSSAQKDTIYIDVDDDITSIIGKVQSSSHKIVALVLPKRATTLQSIVNMKLLKRSADDTKKSLVLITSETGLMPLAGATGIHVAKTLQSKPAIPDAPDANEDNTDIEEVEDVQVDKNRPVGELSVADDVDETIELDAMDDIRDDGSSKKSKKKAGKKFKIPNFDKFRLKLIIACVGLIGLVVIWFLATKVWPTATIVIKTDTSTVSTSFDLTGSPDIEEANVDKSIVQSRIEELRKTDTEKATATGEKNLGDKAVGTMTLTNCIDDGQSHTVPAGTQFSKDGKVFVTDQEVTLNVALYQGNDCRSDDFPGLGAQKDVGVSAANAGTEYNISAGSYNSAIAGISAFGSNMKGGTDKKVKVLSQKDVDEALKRIAERNTGAASEELQQTLKAANYRPFTETLKEGKPTVGTSPNVGEETQDSTVTVTIVYTMIGIDQDGLSKIIEKSVEDKIDTSKQAISDTGLDEAVIRVNQSSAEGDIKMSIQTIVTAGPEIDPDAIKQEILGKKRGDTQSIISNRPGVKSVTVDYSPFWVYSTPKNPDKITINVESINDTGEDSGAAEGS